MLALPVGILGCLVLRLPKEESVILVSSAGPPSTLLSFQSLIEREELRLNSSFLIPVDSITLRKNHPLDSIEKSILNAMLT